MTAIRVLALTRYSRMGASSRVRTIQYGRALGRLGIDLTCSSLFGEDYLKALYLGASRPAPIVFKALLRRLSDLLRSKEHDVIWIEKELFPYLPAAVELSLLPKGIPIILDYDDAVFHNYDRGGSVIRRALLSDKIDRLMSHAQLVTAGNEYLAARATSAGCPKVVLVPSVIDLDAYVLPAQPEAQPQTTIGWIGSPSSTQYLALIESALAFVCQRHSSTLITVGAGKLGLRGVPTKPKLWSEESEVESIRGFTVGIMPLRDGPGERGKCGYKLIQYMACGIPVVASPVGVNVDIVEHGVNGFLASTEEEWKLHLSRLLSDSALRARMGAAGRAKVEARYCLQVTAPQVAQLIRETSLRQ